MEEIAADLTSKAAESLVDQVVRACRYVRCYDRYLRELKDEAKNLDGLMETVHQSVFAAENNMKPIKAQVKKWETDAKSVADKASNMEQRYEKAKKTCFCGCFPNPKARYDVAKEAMETVEAIKKLIPKGQFDKVYYEGAPSGYVPSPPDVNSSAGDRGTPDVNSSAGDGGDIITESRASIFLGIMKALEDEKHKVIGVYGPGGVGKTTLLKEVEKKLKEGGKPFRWIAKAKVSQTPDLKKIQDDIAYALGLDLKDVPSEEGRKDRLYKRLREGPSERILIILDDLWGPLDLEAIGIPLGEETTKCKLLLTSRDQRVLERRMHAYPTFHLKGLSEPEAFRLFEKKVGNKLQDNEELKAKAAQVVRKLAGLPLLIESIASTLKCSDVSTWDNMLIKIEDPNNERIVKWSYDRLGSDDAKCLFLLCGLIGGTIPVELLLGLSMGLGLFVGFNKTIVSSWNRLSDMLGSLRSVGLLQDGGDDKRIVTIHDLYSEVVVSTPFEGQNSLMMNDNSWSVEKLEKCWAICLDDVGSERLAELMTCQFPNLKILMLSQPRNWPWMPEHKHDVSECSGLLDFTRMKEIRVLYLRFMRITGLPSSIDILGSLHSLYLDYCDVKDVAILGKLKTLQILNFAGSTISKLPKEIGDLTNLKSLILRNCDKLKIIEPGILKGLINLEELLMPGSFRRWMGNDEVPSESCNAKLLELKNLTRLTALEIWIPDPTVLLEAGDLPFGNLTRFWINIGDVYRRREFQVLGTMYLKLEGCDGILSKEWVQETLHKTQHLHLEGGLREFKKSPHELCIRGFPQLKHLRIDNSPSIEYIANSSNGLPLTAFTKLESLSLVNLINLEKIWNGPLAPDCFSKLKAVRIEKCHRLKSLGFPSEMKRLVHLEEIKVRECDSLQAIIADDGRTVEVAADDRIVLPNVRLLDLSDLPNMLSFCTGAEGAPIQVSLPNLKKLEVYNTGLAFLFSVSVAKCLREIRDIEVTDCRNMEAVVVDEEGRDEGTDDIIEFPKLKRLNIGNCPMKKFFSCPSGKRELVTTTSDSQDAYSDSFFDRKVSLPNLEVLGLVKGSFKRIWHGELPRSSFCELATLTLEGCSELVNVFPSTIIGRLHNLKEVAVLECPSLESLFDYETLDANTEQTRVLLPKLERVVVDDCRSLKSLFDCGSLSSKMEQTRVLLPKLEGLFVECCPSLESLFDCGSLDSNSEQTIVLLPKLEVLAVNIAEKLRHVMKSDSQTVLDFPSLTHITIQRCRNFGAFNSSPTSVDRKLDKTAEENDESPQPMFNEMVKLPNVTFLRIGGAQCKELWSNHIPDDSFCKLEFLQLKHCDNLQRVASSHIWKRLHRSLEVLQVKSCRSIKIIYEGDDTVMKSGKLRRLVLRDLENLRHIWQSGGHPNVPLPSLRFIKVQSCPRLRMLFPTFTPDFLGQIKELAVESCEDMELIAGHEECEEATGTAITFSELTALRLFQLPKFKSFLHEKYPAEFPALQVLSRVSCGTEQDQCLGDWAPSEEPRPNRQISVGSRSWCVI